VRQNGERANKLFYRIKHVHPVFEQSQFPVSKSQMKFSNNPPESELNNFEGFWSFFYGVKGGIEFQKRNLFKDDFFSGL
jgi:hypothetical protein